MWPSHPAGRPATAIRFETRSALTRYAIAWLPGLGHCNGRHAGRIGHPPWRVMQVPCSTLILGQELPICTASDLDATRWLTLRLECIRRLAGDAGCAIVAGERDCLRGSGAGHQPGAGSGPGVGIASAAGVAGGGATGADCRFARLCRCLFSRQGVASRPARAPGRVHHRGAGCPAGRRDDLSCGGGSAGAQRDGAAAVGGDPRHTGRRLRAHGATGRSAVSRCGMAWARTCAGGGCAAGTRPAGGRRSRSHCGVHWRRAG